MSHFIKRLKIILRYDDVSGLIIYLVPSVLLLLLSISYGFLIIPYILYLIYLYKRMRRLFLYSIIISIFIFLVFIVNYIIFYYAPIQDKLTGIITYKDNNYFLIKKGFLYYKIYYKNTDEILIGEKISLIISPNDITERNVPNTFSYYKYKLQNRIIGEYNLVSFRVIKKHSIYSIRQLTLSYIENKFNIDTSMYLKRIILGISSFDNDLNNAIKDEGILFLFAISGLHIGLISKYFKKLLNIFNVPLEITSVLLVVLLIAYSFIVKESSSVSRSIFMIVVIEILSLLNKRIERLDLLTYSFIIYLIINPFSIYNIGFYLTFLSTAVIYLSKEKNIVKLSLSIIIFSSPLILYSNSEISLFILFYSLFFSIVFERIIIPLSYLTFIFYPFDFLYNALIKTLNIVIKIFNDFNIKLGYSISNVYYLILIYFLVLLIFIFLKDKKKLILYVTFLIITLTFNYIGSVYSFFPSVEMIDVGQGDSFLIRTGFKNILIDTGYEDDYHTTITYLKSMNIHKLDAIFLSHADDDHDGELENIKKELNVKKVYSSLDGVKFKYNQVYIDTYSLDNKDPNEGSMVMNIKINGISILFTGDIEKMGEEYILSKDIKDITILKVPHHGSNTSSSVKFVNKLNPKICLISVGKNNKYGHPNKEVIDRYNNIGSIIYRTDELGTVKIKIINNHLYIDSFRKDNLFWIFNLKNKRFILN